MLAAAAAAPQPSSPRGASPARRLARARDQPEAVASDAVHVRIDHRNGGRRGNHRFDGVAAFPQDAGGALRGERMRCDGHAAAASGRR
jgi:hypothetical protein